MKYSYFEFVNIFLIIFVCSVSASEGDRSPFYQSCVSKCIDRNCTAGGTAFKPSVEAFQPLANRLLLWKCDEECRYVCMWRTVRAFEERGWGPIKFHGKWPFLRALGVQEWGSVLGSILNLLPHLLMFNKLNAAFLHSNTPLLWLWKTFSIICVHGWIWSIIFHARDTPFTEFMDYACALSMVMVLFLTSVVRLLYGKSKNVTVLVTVVSVLYYVSHVHYLYTGRIDYQYNMIANIVPGALGVILWSAWGIYRYRRYHYTWRILLFNILATLFLSLELLEFPPYLYLWDAHALWHVSTAILPSILYRFVNDDLVYLRKSWPDVIVKSDTKIC